jgi:hypothetical protein
MFKQQPVPANFQPDFVKDFVVDGLQFTVQVQYMGPVPSMSGAKEPEVFWFAFYHLNELIDSGTLDWDPENGALTYEKVAAAVLLFCNKNAE